MNGEIMRDHRMNPFSVTVPAGVGRFIDVRLGDSLFVAKQASAPFDREFDEWGKMYFEDGMQEDVGQDRFRQVRIYNRSATEILTVEGLVGRGSGVPGIRYEARRLLTTRKKASGLITAGNGSGNAVLYAGTATSAAGYSAAGIVAGARRRQFAITTRANNTAVIYLATAAADASIFAIVAPGDGYTEEIDHDVYIYSAGAGNDYAVSETFYVA